MRRDTSFLIPAAPESKAPPAASRILPQPLSPSLIGLVDPGVIQTPRHLIKARGQQVTLRCSPMPGHLSVSWYQQVLGQGLRFLFEYYNKQQREKGNLSDRFSAQQFGDSSSELNVSSLELTDSALYLCASSMTQLCATSSLLHRNTPAPLRTGPRGQLQPPVKQPGLPQTLVLLLVCLITFVMQEKDYFTCLYV